MNLTWNQYIEITSLKREWFDTDIDFKCEELAIALDVDTDNVKVMTPDEFNIQYSKLSKYLMSTTKPVTSLNILGVTLELMPFNKMTLGEWIDLDYYVQNKDWLACIALIYRIKIDGGFEKEDKWEEWGSYVHKRKLEFAKTSLDLTRGSLYDLLKWRINFIESNSELFKVEETDMEEDTTSNAYKLDQELARRQQKFAWESMVMNLCADDITKFNEVISLPLLLIFNILAMKKTLNK